MQNNKTELNKSFEDNSQVRVLAFIEAKEGKRQELLDILISIIEPSRKEEGNISYFLNYSIDNPNEMVFDELWSNKAAFDKHYQSSYSQENRNKIKDLLKNPMTIKLFKEISNRYQQ
jgi:quinol monooxygenase YgiN